MQSLMGLSPHRPCSFSPLWQSSSSNSLLISAQVRPSAMVGASVPDEAEGEAMHSKASALEKKELDIRLCGAIILSLEGQTGNWSENERTRTRILHG